MFHIFYHKISKKYMLNPVEELYGITNKNKVLSFYFSVKMIKARQKNMSD